MSDYQFPVDVFPDIPLHEIRKNVFQPVMARVYHGQILRGGVNPLVVSYVPRDKDPGSQRQGMAMPLPDPGQIPTLLTLPVHCPAP